MWLWRTRFAAYMLLALLILMALGQLDGQIGCPFAASLRTRVCALDDAAFRAVLVHPQMSGVEVPAPSTSGPAQSHELHHAHGQFAVLLTIFALLPPLVILVFKSAPRHSLFQISLTPPSPPPRFALL